MSEKLDDLTLKEIREMGAHVQIAFHHNKNLQAAYNKLKPFMSLGNVKREASIYSDTTWLCVEDYEKRLQATSFLSK